MPTTTEATTAPPAPTARVVVVLLFVLSVIVLPVATNVIQVHRFPALSRLDEPAHIDYLRRVYDFEVPRLGDRLLPATRRDISCRTIEGRGAGGSCDEPIHDAGEYDADGYSYEAQQPPLYYFVTATMLRPLLLVVNGFVNGARLLGAVWNAAGLALLWWCLRRRHAASAPAAALACSTLALTPLIVTQTATVTNDSAALLIGAAVLVGYHELKERRTAALVAVASVVGVLLVFTKPLAILPIGAATLALLADLFHAKRPLKDLSIAAIPGIVALLSYQLWQQIRDARGLVSYATITDALLGFRPTVSGFSPGEALGSVDEFVRVYWTTDGTLAAAPYVVALAMIVGLFLIVAPSISNAMGDGRPPLRHLQIALLFVALVAPPLLVAQSYLQVQRMGGANARYALSMLPLAVPAVIPWMERRWQRWFGVLLLGGFFAATCYSLVTTTPPGPR